jgi:copper chaperone CopZ
MKTELAIEGMHCDGCVRRVKNLLSKVEGLEHVDVALGRASFEGPSSEAVGAACAALTKAGFQVSSQPTQ